MKPIACFRARLRWAEWVATRVSGESIRTLVQGKDVRWVVGQVDERNLRLWGGFFSDPFFVPL